MASLLEIFSHFLLAFLYIFPAFSSRKLDLGSKETKTYPLLPSKISAFSSRFDPSKSVQLSWNPRVFLYEGFISDEECDHLLSLSNASNSEVSSNNGFQLARQHDEIILRIEERISAWTFLPIENGEDMKIFHYRANNGSKPLYQHGEDDFENAQVAAILIFLSNVSHGGETIFPKSKIKMWSDCTSSGLAVKHVRSNALLIFSLHPNATADASSHHGWCSVLEGGNWFAIKWMHVRAFDRNKLFSSDSKEECTDEHESCPQWAAMGECQKNSIYMLGTSDYFGSCRKSCGVC